MGVSSPSTSVTSSTCAERPGAASPGVESVVVRGADADGEGGCRRSWARPRARPSDPVPRQRARALGRVCAGWRDAVRPVVLGLGRDEARPAAGGGVRGSRAGRGLGEGGLGRRRAGGAAGGRRVGVVRAARGGAGDQVVRARYSDAVTVCSSCGAENAPGQKFCGECGAQLQSGCPSCGYANPPGQKFCGECGAALTAQAAVAAERPPEAPATASERRLVTILFADLVGFTTLSESRDAEEVRELLSRYFDTCSRLIGLYGGTVEKFIGDAVMAVWGTPVATEDDAERAVRAALDLVKAVSALGDEVGASELRVRAGVLTGEAAVTIGATGEGMVAGDLVNTASRIQSVAQPGSVFVGETTRRSSEQAIAYEDSGEHELKGKQAPVRLWRALRVVSARRGELKAEGLEAPFVGRERELRQIKDLFHACAEERKAHLVSVTGIAGIGKSRLAWGFYKYFDGIVETVWWHRGPLPRVRRGRDVLGARRHGADALPDRRGRPAGRRAREAPRDAERARAGRRGAALRRAAARAAPRRRRGGRGRAPGAVRGVAAVLRAAGRVESGASRLRGLALGGCEPPRLHRVPARVVAQPAAVRDHARETRVAREATDVGSRAAQLLVALPRATPRTRDGRAAARPRPGAAGGAEGADPRARGGGAALRGGDGADAARPRAARPGGLCLPCRRAGRDARGTGDAARPDRCTSRRSERGGATAAAKRRRARQDVHAQRARRARRARGGGAGAAARIARAQGGAVAPGGPALAGARPVRLPSGPRASRRLRDAGKARPQGPPPGGRRPPCRLPW